MAGYVVLAVALVASGYLLGGVPFGAVVGRRLGVDITTLGSGNTGATNVYRTMGWKAALVVALLDIAKGAVPALLARLLPDASWSSNARDLLVVAAGGAAIAGHMYSPYFRLRGGKGIATAAGAILVLMPEAFLALLVLFAILVLITRIVSVASIISAVAFPLTTFLLYPTRPVLLWFSVAAAALVIWRHRSNIGRLVRGEESRITMGTSSHKRRKEQP